MPQWQVWYGAPDLSIRWYLYGGGWMNDSISSILNGTNVQMCFYAHANFVGFLFSISPGQEYWLVPRGNDEISSYKAC